MKKILLIPNQSTKDILLITPIIRALKTELGASVHLLTYEKCVSLLYDNPYLEHTHTNLASSISTIRRGLISYQFDLVIDFNNTMKSRFVRFGLGKKAIVFKKSNFKTWLYAKLKVNLLPNAHVVDQYFEFLKPMGIKPDQLGVDFYIPEKDEVENSWLPKTHQNGYALVAISGEYQTRKLPVERLIELCDRINKPIVLIGDKTDLTLANEIEGFFQTGTKEEESNIEALNKKALIFNACNKFNFNQMASLIKNANWVFSYDNELLHIASSFKKTIFSIWGSTSPNFGYYPYQTKFTIFENKKLSCRPCSSKGFNKCPKGHFKCMNDVSFDFYLPD